jgi:hypothetical protein
MTGLGGKPLANVQEVKLLKIIRTGLQEKNKKDESEGCNLLHISPWQLKFAKLAFSLPTWLNCQNSILLC